MLTSMLFCGVLAGLAAQPEIWVRTRVELAAPDEVRRGVAWSVTAGVRLTPEAGGAAGAGAAARRGRRSPARPVGSPSPKKVPS
jgi:hypothetical protein